MEGAVGNAPGRVNLIGEHTDYNDGLVLPIALRLGVTARAARSADAMAHLRTDAEVTPREVGYALGGETPDGTWADRVRGITATLARRGHSVGGFTAQITSTLPAGAGLGSSAAFAVAVTRALDALFGLGLGDDDLVRIAHTAENEFAGARSGLLDQMSSVYGRPSVALLIDIRDLRTETIPLPSEIELAVIDSGMRHEHATGGYNRRRAECEEAARHLGLGSLREIEPASLDDALERLPPPLDRRTRHVVTENVRVREAVDAVRAADIARLGALLDASHRSLRDDYEVSTPDLDRLVELANGDRDVLGARLVGGGFGGSILALTRRGAARAAAERVLARYGGGRFVAVVP